MSHPTTLTRPSQLTPERPCPIGCEADHCGELPGERHHWTTVANIRTPDGMLCVGLEARDANQPEILVHYEDGRELRIPDHVATAVANAIASAAGTLWAAA